jgi:hypothetical protein
MRNICKEVCIMTVKYLRIYKKNNIIFNGEAKTPDM